MCTFVKDDVRIPDDTSSIIFGFGVKGFLVAGRFPNTTTHYEGTVPSGISKQ